MTAPPRPNLGILRAHAEVGVPGLTRELYETIAYILYLERELESAEAALDRMRERPDPDSWRGP